jgi:predicted patatin/cPLA2 family phospholipase
MAAQNPKKLAVVCAAGGMSCAYIGGALAALAIEHGIVQPDYLVAASGSAGSAIYYLTGQYDSLRRIWTEHISSPHFISFRRLHKIMDVDYLVDTIIRQMEPLDLEKLSMLDTRYFIAARNAATGKGRYFSCREGQDIHELLRATKALPFFYGRKVELDDGFYLDAAFRITKEHSIRKAIELGATHIIVIQVNNRIPAASPEMTNPNLEIIRVGPDKNPAYPISKDPALITASYQKGYLDVRDSEKLRGFLEPFLRKT